MSWRRCEGTMGRGEEKTGPTSVLAGGCELHAVLGLWHLSLTAKDGGGEAALGLFT